MPVRDRTRATRLEILGAWLRLWTPPRDVEIPPVPWRKVALGAAVLALVAVFAALVIAPAIDESKDRSAAEERREEERRRAERRERVRAEQRAHTGRLTTLAGVEAAIGADAKERFDADGRPAECEPAPGADASAPRMAYDCFVTIREIEGAGEQEGARGALAIPYRAVLDEDTGRYAFCKVVQVAGEAAIADPRDVVPLPAACRA